MSGERNTNKMSGSVPDINFPSLRDKMLSSSRIGVDQVAVVFWNQGAANDSVLFRPIMPTSPALIVLKPSDCAALSVSHISIQSFLCSAYKVVFHASFPSFSILSPFLISEIPTIVVVLSTFHLPSQSENKSFPILSTFQESVHLLPSSRISMDQTKDSLEALRRRSAPRMLPHSFRSLRKSSSSSSTINQNNRSSHNRHCYSENHCLTDAEIAGIILGAIVGMVLLVLASLMVRYYFKRGRCLGQTAMSPVQ